MFNMNEVKNKEIDLALESLSIQLNNDIDKFNKLNNYLISELNPELAVGNEANLIIPIMNEYCFYNLESDKSQSFISKVWEAVKNFFKRIIEGLKKLFSFTAVKNKFQKEKVADIREYYNEIKRKNIHLKDVFVNNVRIQKRNIIVDNNGYLFLNSSSVLADMLSNVDVNKLATLIDITTHEFVKKYSEFEKYKKDIEWSDNWTFEEIDKKSALAKEKVHIVKEYNELKEDFMIESMLALKYGPSVADSFTPQNLHRYPAKVPYVSYTVSRDDNKIKNYHIDHLSRSCPTEIHITKRDFEDILISVERLVTINDRVSNKLSLLEKSFANAEKEIGKHIVLNKDKRYNIENYVAQAAYKEVLHLGLPTMVLKDLLVIASDSVTASESVMRVFLEENKL